jgi:hypothetical protein
MNHRLLARWCFGFFFGRADGKDAGDFKMIRDI